MARDTTPAGPPEPESPTTPTTAYLDAESDRALRWTWRRGFPSSEAAEALEVLADLTLTTVRNDFKWRFDAGEELAGAAMDLDSLADYLAWEASSRDEGDPDERERELSRYAKTWETRLRALVREIRATVGEGGEQAESDPGTVARSILSDLEALVERVREVLGQRGGDPARRALRPAMAGALSSLVQAEAALTPAVEVQTGEVE